MSKELEALENIREDIVNAYVLVKGKGKYTDDDFDIVEKALKDYYALKKECDFSFYFVRIETHFFLTIWNFIFIIG